MEFNLGIIKEIDNLGRIVIPKEFRERLKLEKRVELVLTKSGLLIRNAEYEMAKIQKPRNQKKIKSQDRIAVLAFCNKRGSHCHFMPSKIVQKVLGGGVGATRGCRRHTDVLAKREHFPQKVAPLFRIWKKAAFPTFFFFYVFHGVFFTKTVENSVETV